MAKTKASPRAVGPAGKGKEPDDDDSPTLLRARFMAREQAGKANAAFRKKLTDATLAQLGVTREELEKRADAAFDRARTDSLARMEKLRKLGAAERRKRGPLAARVTAALARFGGMEELQ
jgi:hypothetical protein